MFGIFLFLTYYMQVSLGYSPVISGAGLPADGGRASPSSANVSNIVLLPRIGPKPIVVAAFLLLAGGQIWLTQDRRARGLRGRHPRPAHDHRHRHGPHVLDRDQHRHLRGRAARRGRRVGLGEHRAAARRVDRHLAAQHDRGQRHGQPTSPATWRACTATPTAATLHAVQAAGFVHGYTTVFWWCTGIFLAGAVICGTLMRSGPLQGHGARRRARARRGDGGEPVRRRRAVSAPE